MLLLLTFTKRQWSLQAPPAGSQHHQQPGGTVPRLMPKLLILVPSLNLMCSQKTLPRLYTSPSTRFVFGNGSTSWMTRQLQHQLSQVQEEIQGAVGVYRHWGLPGAHASGT